jgi:hypothetical protein
VRRQAELLVRGAPPSAVAFLIVPTHRRLLGTPELFVAVSLDHDLTPLDRTFDVIFMVAGDNRAGIVHKFSMMRSPRFEISSWEGSRSSADDFAETHGHQNLLRQNQRG